MSEEFEHIEEVMSEGFEGKEVSIRGWIYRTRSSGGVHFVVVRDSTGIIQCIVRKGSVSEKAFEDAGKALIESSVQVRGVVRKDARAPGGYELDTTDFKVTHFSEVFPITKDKSTEFLLDVRHLWLRSRMLTAVMKVKATVLSAAREFFAQNGYVETTPPIITGSACEGGATLFTVDYFGQKAYLSQSVQLYLEALIYSLEKVYCISPSFRAEPSRTLRHLAEYWHIEPEAAYADLEDVMKLSEEFVMFTVEKVLEKNKKELELLGREPEALKRISAPFPRMRYSEAIDLLQKEGLPIKFGQDLGADEEKAMSAHFDQPVFVTHYPKEVKAFYMRENREDPKFVNNFDLLAPEAHGELIGGSEREEEFDRLLANIKRVGEDPKSYEWYLDLRRYGSVPHAGFGAGAERIVKWLCNLEHIRDAIPFPRTINRATP